MSAVRKRVPALGLVLLGALTVAGMGGCNGEPSVVDLGKLRVAVWQPQRLASAEGDLLDDAVRVEMTLLVDGKEQSVALDGLLAEDREAAAKGSQVQATVRTVGNELPDAIGRSPKVRLAPEGGDVTVRALLAPPDVAHELSTALPTARTGMAVCASDDGWAWAIGGQRFGGVLEGGSFVLDPTTREVREGAPLPELRVFASCVADEKGGVYLAGGCAGDGTPVGSLAYSATGELGSAYNTERTLPVSSCHTALAMTSAGTLVALTGSHLHLIPSDGGAATQLPLPSPRFGAVLATFPQGEQVLIGGGFSDVELTLPVTGSLLYDLKGGGPLQLEKRLNAAAREGDALVVVDGTHISRLLSDGTLETLHTLSLPSGFVPTQIASLHDGRYALLDPNDSRLQIVGDGAPSTITVGRREHLFSDPGGALLLFGGDKAGVSVVVVE